jgi:ADP-L-glycero-D-manno-heptose 6-epimerase
MQGKIIVTGAAGFIGCNLVAELNRRGRTDILLVDALGQDEKWRNLVGLQYEDMLTPDQFLNRVRCDSGLKADALIHLGACSATTERDAGFLLENNYRYTRTLCEWALAHDTRFVYASSAATYGDGSLGYSDDAETTPRLRPLNMYGYSKHMFDLWALRHALFDHIVGLKYFNVYGPHEEHKGDMRSVVHKAFGQIVDRGWVELFKSDRPEYADGGQERDFIYVRDVVDVTLHFAEHREKSGLLNCGTGKARSWNDLVGGVFTALGRTPDIRYIDMPPALLGKYQYFTQACPKNLRAAGYAAPFTELEDGIRDYVSEFLMRSTD